MNHAYAQYSTMSLFSPCPHCLGPSPAKVLCAFWEVMGTLNSDQLQQVLSILCTSNVVHSGCKAGPII